MASWSLCIATLDRHEALLACLGYAVAQTRPPAEIVVVDASDNWEEGRAATRALLAGNPEVALDYIGSPVRSSAEQRNIAVRSAGTDVLFLLDDDSFMHPTCAEEIMRVYEADDAGAVAGVMARNVSELPPGEESVAQVLARKRSGRSGLGAVWGRLLHTRTARWINRKLLLQSIDELFIKYDEPRERPVPPALAGLEVQPVSLVGGCVMTVRRHVALAEPFDPSLRYYAAFEDLDASYRYARHGALLYATRARLHHFEAAGGRIRRKKVIVFQLLNMLVFIKRHAARPEAFLSAYRRMLWRRLLGEILKDLLSGRWSLPQVGGVLVAMRHWNELWRTETDRLDEWYPTLQKTILDEME